MIQIPTDWMNPKEIEPPADVVLMMRCIPLPEMKMPDIDVIYIGHWSAKNRVFISAEKNECLSEILDVTHYHVVISPSGETIPAYLTDHPLYNPLD